ncbi:MAG: ATP-binding protein, partial [Alphaproteobacteria bacterium]|nr:ATP-binding protein [Alphaproteobacteria bacterium]
VSDNGPGIPAEILARLPEPLFSTRDSGTGLGLPVVQRIMDDHGGSLQIDSRPGQGTQVILRLPHADQS